MWLMMVGFFLFAGAQLRRALSDVSIGAAKRRLEEVMLTDFVTLSPLTRWKRARKGGPPHCKTISRGARRRHGRRDLAAAHSRCSAHRRQRLRASRMNRIYDVAGKQSRWRPPSANWQRAI